MPVLVLTINLAVAKHTVSGARVLSEMVSGSRGHLSIKAVALPPPFGQQPAVAGTTVGADESDRPALPVKVIQALPVLVEPGPQLGVRTRVVSPRNWSSGHASGITKRKPHLVSKTLLETAVAIGISSTMYRLFQQIRRPSTLGPSGLSTNSWTSLTTHRLAPSLSGFARYCDGRRPTHGRTCSSWLATRKMVTSWAGPATS